jgi:hypothetical protein
MLPTIVQAGRMLPTVVVDAVANTSHYEFQGNAFLVGVGVEWNALAHAQGPPPRLWITLPWRNLSADIVVVGLT